jgi:hypothetical protein
MINLLLSSIFIILARAEDPGRLIKQKLNQELQQVFFVNYEAKFGSCGNDPSKCLTVVDNDYIVANLPKREFCFPSTVCGFYHCMEESYHCSDVGVNYFTKLAFPTCSAYVTNIANGNFSEKGVEWIYSVMTCLQKGLTDECVLNGNCPTSTEASARKKTCDHITDFTLAFHPGCYLKSGVGVCHLPIQDKIAIWQTVNTYMTKREREEAYKVIFECLSPQTSTILSL